MRDAQREAGEFLLGRLVRLCGALAATADPEQAGQLLANRIGEVLACDRAVLVSLAPPRPRHVSDGIAAGERTALADAIGLAAARAGADAGPQRLEAGRRAGAAAGRRTARADEGADALLDALERCLREQGGTRVLWWPLPQRDGGAPRWALWLERHHGRAWSDDELGLAHRVGGVLAALLPATAARSPRRGRALLAALVVLGLAGAIPVPSAITAPVQVVAAAPRHVFSAIDGIVGTLAVVPGQQVAAGDLLLRMDTRVLEKNVQEARQAMSVAQAELARNRAAAHYDADARAKLAVTQVELERARLELDFHLAQLERAELRSETAGQVLLEDPDRLPGAAVRMGERLLGIADTRRTRLRILVPLADFSLVDEGAPVRVTLDRSPLAGLSARVVRKGYTVQLSDEQVPSIVVEAEWEVNAGEEGGATEGAPDVAGGRAGTPPAVPFGARGSARIRGEQVALAQHLLRKPLQALRRVWAL